MEVFERWTTITILKWTIEQIAILLWLLVLGEGRWTSQTVHSRDGLGRRTI